MEPGDVGGRVAVHSTVKGDRSWGDHCLVGRDISHIGSNYMGQEMSRGVENCEQMKTIIIIIII